jgi:hypothetical protein
LAGGRAGGQASLRVLGALFFEGPNVLFQVSLAILKIMEEAILATDLGDVAVPLIKDFVAHPDETLLFQVVYTIYIIYYI